MLEKLSAAPFEPQGPCEEGLGRPVQGLVVDVVDHGRGDRACCVSRRAFGSVLGPLIVRATPLGKTSCVVQQEFAGEPAFR